MVNFPSDRESRARLLSGRHGKHYCCQACAEHHSNGEPCTASKRRCAGKPK
ncbi:hypothetical protein HX866_27180 [Pseudomonas gingeri]|nr:hypothetical protein [Pseudomonas gingeri]